MSKFAKDVLKGFLLSVVIFATFIIGVKVGIKITEPKIIHLERNNKMREERNNKMQEQIEKENIQGEQRNIIEEGGTQHYEGDINYNLKE